MRTTEMVLCAHYLKTSKFIPVCISIYILSLPGSIIIQYTSSRVPDSNLSKEHVHRVSIEELPLEKSPQGVALNERLVRYNLFRALCTLFTLKTEKKQENKFKLNSINIFL